jgi:hypothetical protein
MLMKSLFSPTMSAIDKKMKGFTPMLSIANTIAKSISIRES